MTYEPRIQDQPKLDSRFILHLPANMKRDLLAKAGETKRSAADLAREGIARVLDTAA